MRGRGGAGGLARHLAGAGGPRPGLGGGEQVVEGVEHHAAHTPQHQQSLWYCFRHTANNTCNHIHMHANNVIL